MEVKVGDLAADNAVLSVSSEWELHALVTTLKEGCENIGLSLNASKTKVLEFERSEERAECKVGVYGKILEQSTEVVYLESMSNRHGRNEVCVERRIACDNRVIGALGALMRRRNISTTASMYLLFLIFYL